MHLYAFVCIFPERIRGGLRQCTNSTIQIDVYITLLTLCICMHFMLCFMYIISSMYDVYKSSTRYEIDTISIGISVYAVTYR